MNMPSERVQFGTFVLDVDRYELTRAGKPVRMERIPMDLLILLVREKGRLERSAIPSETTPETRSTSRPFSAKGIASGARRSSPLEAIRCRSRQNGLASCSPFFHSKI
jgi:hypothetical protein